MAGLGVFSSGSCSSLFPFLSFFSYFFAFLRETKDYTLILYKELHLPEHVNTDLGQVLILFSRAMAELHLATMRAARAYPNFNRETLFSTLLMNDLYDDCKQSPFKDLTRRKNMQEGRKGGFFHHSRGIAHKPKSNELKLGFEKIDKD